MNQSTAPAWWPIELSADQLNHSTNLSCNEFQFIFQNKKIYHYLPGELKRCQSIGNTHKSGL